MKVDYHYYLAKSASLPSSIEFASLADLYQYTEQNNIHTIFKLMNESGEECEFAILNNALMLKHATEGYKTLEDFGASVLHHFPDAATFYAAIEAGYRRYEDYKLVIETGINDKDLYDKIKNKGFIQGYNEFLLLPTLHPFLPELPTPILHAYQLYEYAMKNGFDKYADFEEVFILGFIDKPTYKVAKEFGFKNQEDYKTALLLGFRNNEELVKARKAGARDRNDLLRFSEIQLVGDNSNTTDEKLLMILFSKLEQGKRVSLNKLYDILHNKIAEYVYEDTKEFPTWITNQFEDKEKLKSFLTKGALKPYGQYDEDGEFFQINKMQEREVIIDASNVAYNSIQGKTQSKPLVSNIIKMVEYLKKNDFTTISVIADASLRYKLGDMDKLKELEKMVDYKISPPETSADIFIINYVKSKHCLMVSNDTFKDWKIQDPWVANNIDFYRLSFMIKDNEVLMPELKVIY